ncbi:MAG: SRPBCC family protein, partial [Ilumatobacteraceae bacterium]
VHLLSDRRYDFAMTPEELWACIIVVPSYPTWWPWLRSFDGTRLAEGEVWQSSVQPPLPYAVRFTVSIDAVVPARRVAATIKGDVIGTAELHIEPRAKGCQARLVADLGPDKSALRALSIAARPLVRFGHNWVLDTGARQFRSRSSAV